MYLLVLHVPASSSFLHVPASQGQPLNIGVFVDETYDIGRIEETLTLTLTTTLTTTLTITLTKTLTIIEDVHFNP